MSDDRLMNAEEVAQLLSVPLSWVRQETREGRLPSIRLGRYWRYRRERVLAWLEEREEIGRKHQPRVRV